MQRGTAGSASGSNATGLRDGIAMVMDVARGSEKTWPPDSRSEHFDALIYNSLLRSLKEQSIGWHHSDAEGSGKTLLTALSKALQYSLPFDLQGALSRRGMHIPVRFTAEKLEVQPPKRNVATRDVWASGKAP